MNSALLSIKDILALAEPTLRSLPAHEQAEAEAWLAAHVMTAPNLASQLVLLETWQSIANPQQYERLHATTRNE